MFDIANAIYSIPKEGEIETPTMEQDEATNDESDSDVSIEPYAVGWKIMTTRKSTCLTSCRMRWASSIESSAWPPRVLDEQPLARLMN